MISPERTILLVEDCEDDVLFMQNAMRRAGFINPVQVAVDGQKAMDYLGGLGKYSDRESFPMPCLVLLDLKLPKASGFEVLEWIRADTKLRSLPVVILSGSSLIRDTERAHEKGANSYLVKPPTKESLEGVEKVVGECWVREEAGN